MGITCDICGEPCRRRVGSHTRSRPGQARGLGRVKHEATAGSSTRPRPGQARGRGSCGGHCQGRCEAGARERHGRPFAQDLSPHTTTDKRRPPGIIPGGRRFVRSFAEASVRRPRSGGVADPASDSCGASWPQLVEPCDQLRHVAPWSLVPRGHALREARPPTLHP